MCPSLSINEKHLRLLVKFRFGSFHVEEDPRFRLESFLVGEDHRY